MSNAPINQPRRIAGNLFIALGLLALFGSAGAKLAHVSKVVEELTRHGFEGGKLNLIAVLEVSSAILLLVPLTRSLGLLMVSSYLGGAISTHVQFNESPLSPCVILALIWLGTWLRHPVVLWSLGRRLGSDPGAVVENSRGKRI